jgi:hypothetical protein
MAVNFQLVIDCANPDRLARFWVSALGYVFEPAPDGFASWDDYWRDFGLPEEDLGLGEDRISDPEGCGPRICFMQVPEGKTIKNRLHLDINASGIGKPPLETRKRNIHAEAERLAALGATMLRVNSAGQDHYAIAMQDPEGNEFDIH